MRSGQLTAVNSLSLHRRVHWQFCFLEMVNPHFPPPLMEGAEGGELKASAVGVSQPRWMHASARGHT
jgi:hypothetical protein